jgi:HPt (histidine-containing phosphotransfer) domain-containing protein
MLRGLEDGADRGVVRRIMCMFLDTAPNFLEALRRASGHGDTNALPTASHTLKSASAAIGAVSLAERCASLEALVREGSVADAMTVVAAIIKEYEVIKPTIEAHAHGMEEPVT